MSKVETRRHQEIERKFLVERVPFPLEQYPVKHIQQGYIVIDEDGFEVRVRKANERHTLTMKSGTDMARVEVENELTQDEFNALWPLTGERHIMKSRYEVPHNNHIVEVDVFKGALTGLVTAEIEFATVESAAQFIGPNWLGVEVTFVKEYKNQALAIFGHPKA